MIWFLFAALTATFESLKDVTSKHSLENVDEYIVSWALIFFTLPLLLPLLFFIDIPALGNQFGWALLIGGGLNVISMILYIKALKHTDLSIAVPLITFTPLFLLVTSPLIVNEYPTVADGFGIFLIVVGSYILNLKQKQQGWFAPFRALVTNQGSRLMLLVAFIWSITSNFDKVGVNNSSPTFWAVANYSFITLAMFPIMLYKSHRHLKQIRQHFVSIVPIGLFHGAAVLFQMQAISLTLVAQVIAVKRLSVLLSVILGHLIFKEVGLKRRATGAVAMIAGVVIITLF
jgi:drug/metabolite transporter (DMT)-like permease